MNRAGLTILFFSLAVITVRAQRTCGTVELAQKGKSEPQILQEKQLFENWLLEKKASLKWQNALQSTSETTIYTIPIVVHIIHNGEPYGTGLNIPDEQIEAQITALNRDFRHLNADSINTPAMFQPLMADIGFEFVLAKRTPTGLPTMGITRTNGHKTAWNLDTEATQLKALSYWDSNDYFNIWVAPTTYYLGMSTYPISTLGGLEDATNDPLNDGVIIKTEAFGSVELYPQGNYSDARFDLGRTATHEVGHFFGLRHISGDGGCNVDDYVADTPQTSAQNFNCPAPFSLANSCTLDPAMFMNYMDYVNDDCMNLFSLGQKERMIIVVNNSPRRASLLTSPALNPPEPLDAAITAIPTPEQGICDDLITPSVTVLNNGSAIITTLSLSTRINSVEQYQQLYNISLALGEDTTLVLNQLSLVQYGTQELTIAILSTNGIQDSIAANDIFSKQLFYSEQVTSLDEDFSRWPATWAVRTSAPISNWNFLQAPNIQISNTAAVLSYYGQTSGFIDQLITPSLDLSTYTHPYFLFDHSYAYRNGYDDQLVVLVSLDCGNTFSDTLFIKSGQELAALELPIEFTPSGPVDWQTSALDLSAYAGEIIQLSFAGKPLGGNNIYLDNFILVDAGYEDICLKGLVNEAAAFGPNIATVGAFIENSGTTIINNIDIKVTVDNSNENTITPFTNLGLQPGQRITLPLPLGAQLGSHNLKIESLLNDANSNNNTLDINANFIGYAEQIPYRERFDNGDWNKLNNWTITSPSDNIGWQIWPDNKEYIYYPAFSSGNAGLHDWLVLPPLDFSGTNLATLEYKVAYARQLQKNDLLQLWVSTNGGDSFEYLVQSLYGLSLSTLISNEEWVPQSEDDWSTKFVDLSEFAGEENVLLAFRTIDANGNNIYLDDIEFFVTDAPRALEVGDEKVMLYPNPVTDLNAKVTFNLADKQDVRVRILDIQGNVISDQQFTNVLNQTFPLELNNQRNGIYLVQTVGNDFNTVSRILVSH